MDHLTLAIASLLAVSVAGLIYARWFEHRENQREAAMWHELILRHRAGEFDVEDSL